MDRGELAETHKEHADNVEDKSNRRVEEQHSVAGLGKIIPLESRRLRHGDNKNVHDGADGREVVQADERIHADAFSTEHDLNHDKSDCLEYGATELEDEANPGELNFASTGDGHTTHYEKDVSEGAQVWGSNSPGP